MEKRKTLTPLWFIAAERAAQKVEDHTPSIQRRKIFHLCIATLLVGVFIFQSAILNLYFRRMNLSIVFILILIGADIICLAIFIYTFIIAYRYLISTRYGDPGTNVLDDLYLDCKFKFWHYLSIFYFGIMPLSYISWIVYSCTLMTKVFVLLLSISVEDLHRFPYLDEYALQGTTALSAIVFFALAEGHSWADRFSHRYVYVTLICVETTLDIMDSVDLLTVVYSDYSNDKEADMIVTMVLCFISFLLPAIPLYLLVMTEKTADVMELCICTINDILHLCLMDVPYFILRSYILALNGTKVFTFMTKNCLFIVVLILRIIPNAIECSRLLRLTKKVMKKYRERQKLRKQLDRHKSYGEGEEERRRRRRAAEAGGEGLPRKWRSEETMLIPYTAD